MIKRISNLTLAFIFLFSLSSCGDKTNGNGNPPDTDSTGTGMPQDTSDEPEVEFYAHTDGECDSLGATDFCFKGFQFIKLGDEVTWAQLNVKGGTVKDTVFEEIKMAESGPDTFAWNAKIIDHPDGRVYLEADFEEHRYLNRIRITSPRYKNKKNLHVGSTLQELKAAYPNLYAFPLPAHGVIEVFPSNKLFFHFDLKTIFPNGNPNPDGEFSLGQIPDDAVVTGIVMM